MQHIFITGATSGIGLATAQSMHELGWHIYGSGLPTDDFSQLSRIGNRIVPIQLDITDQQSINNAIQQIDTPINALVNNAGVTIPGALLDLDISEIQRQFDVNVFGHLRVTQAIFPLLAANARIVMVSSVMGRVAMPALGAYSMSKHAIEAMTDTLRLELAHTQMHIASVQMGAINTPLTQSITEHMQKWASKESRFSGLYRGMVKALQQQAKHATPPEQVAKAIVHAVTSNKPKTRYTVGGAAKGLIAMRQFAPDAVGDQILRRALGLYPKD